MKQIIYLVTLFLFITSAFKKKEKENFLKIFDYKKIFIPVLDKKKIKIAIRSYYHLSKLYFIVVDPYTLSLSYMEAKKLDYRKSENEKSSYFSLEDLANSPYIQSLDKYNKKPIKLQNHGLCKGEYLRDQYFLSIDLCPSNRPFEKEFFEDLIQLSKKNNFPTPIAICVSGLWIIKHENEFEWICKQQKEKKLDISWVNHSFSHPYYQDLELESNFLNYQKDHFEYEILEVEKMLVEKGIMPSIFFRFPGLVASDFTIKKLKEHGLIPLGSSCWLGKKETLSKGAIILIHGNGNEVKGIVTNFRKLLKKLHFLPINQTLINP